MLDYYNREYLYFGYAKINGDYWNPTLEEARKESSMSASAELQAKLMNKRGVEAAYVAIYYEEDRRLIIFSGS